MLETPRESSAADVTRLRNCLNDLGSIIALPALSADSEPSQIVSALVDALVGMLRVSFVFVRLNHAAGGPFVEMMRLGDAVGGADPAREIREAIDSPLGDAPPKSPSRVSVSVGAVDLSVASARFGLDGEIGIIVAGSHRRDFPDQTEKLLLDVASNQATIALQRAHLTEQRRVANAIEERVAQRTRELAIANEALRDSEHNSRLLVDSIPGLVALMTAEGELQFANRQILEYTGRTLEELKQWGTSDTVHPEDLPHVIQVFTQSIVSGSPYAIVQRLRQSDGFYHWFENNGFPLRDSSGQIVRWCVLLTDIDERKRAEDGLRARERFRVIVDDLPVMVTLMTPDGEFAQGNRHMLEYFGASLEELKRRPTTSSFHPDDRPSVDARWKESIETGHPYDFEARLRRADGTYRWFHTRGFPLRDAEGGIVLWHLLQTDVDDRKRAEDALRASERNLKLIIDTIPALAWSARPDGSADFFNQHYLEFMGLSAQQACDWGWTAAVHPDDVHGLGAIWQQVLASEQRGEAEARLRRHDGEYRWFLFRVDPLRDERGTVVKWYGVNTDIEDRKRAEDKTRLIIDTALDAVITMDAHGTVTSWNKQAETIFGWSHEEAIGQRLSDMIIPEQQRLVHERGFRHFLATGEGPILGRRVEVTAIRRDGLEFPVELEVMPMRVGQDWIFSAFLRDITDAKLAEENLRKSELDLRHTQAELAHVTRVTTVGELTASITHEINQPLSGIITNASTCLRMLAADPPNVDGARETARRTIRDGNRASDVITRLRALFSKKEPTTESVDLNEATQEVIALSSSELQRTRVILQPEFAADLPPVMGDRVQLQQVILNLLRNASDAMVGVDDRPRQLLVRTEREDGNRVRVTVRDAGTGFDRQSMDNLFEPFYTTKSDGMGMGLSVSRSIVERHHGRLWAELNDGPGATFSFSIPRGPESVTDAGNTKVS
jgi:PAS domain S-box-containing protein